MTFQLRSHGFLIREVYKLLSTIDVHQILAKDKRLMSRDFKYSRTVEQYLSD